MGKQSALTHFQFFSQAANGQPFQTFYGCQVHRHAKNAFARAHPFAGTRLGNCGMDDRHMRIRYIQNYNSTNVRFYGILLKFLEGPPCCTFFRAAYSSSSSLFRYWPLQKTFTWIPAMACRWWKLLCPALKPGCASWWILPPLRS